MLLATRRFQQFSSGSSTVETMKDRDTVIEYFPPERLSKQKRLTI